MLPFVLCESKVTGSDVSVGWEERLTCSNPALQASGKKEKLALLREWLNTLLTEIAGGLRDLPSPYG